MPLQHVTAEDHRQLQDIADDLAASHKIVVITGAGISTSCGIPDFRSKDGLYSLIQQQRVLKSPDADEPLTPTKKRKFSALEDEASQSIPSSQESTTSTNTLASLGGRSIKGKDLFDSRVWKDTCATSTFYTFIASLRKQIFDEVKQTSQTHKFLRVLRDGGRLMRCYTQNIDGLEVREGLSSDLCEGRGSKRRFMRKIYETPRPAHVDRDSDYDGGCEVVPLHGDLQKLRCNLCQDQVDWTDADTQLFLEGEAPSCQLCDSKAQNRRENGKRGLSVGLLRPNIVLYGEQHPSEHLLAPLPPFDMAQGPDVLIVMGTSLKVHGLQNLVRQFAKAVHAQDGRVVFVNRTKPSESIWNDFLDDWVEMDCDDWVLDLRTKREDLWLRQGELDLKTTKAAAKARKRKSNIVEVRSTSGSQQLVAVVIENPKKPTAESGEPDKKKRRSKNKPPASPPPSAATGLPTPPSSHHKRSKKQASSCPFENHTPWSIDPSITPLTKRHEALRIDQTQPPAFSPLKPFMAGSSNTPWILPSPYSGRTNAPGRQHTFTIYQDPSSSPEISPIKERILANGNANVAAEAAAGILSARTDLNTKILPPPAPPVNGKSSGTPTTRRSALSINDLLN